MPTERLSMRQIREVPHVTLMTPEQARIGGRFLEDALKLGRNYAAAHALMAWRHEICFMFEPGFVAEEKTAVSFGVIARLQAAGLNATAVQNPLTTLADAVASAERVLARQGGPTVLVGHSFSEMIVTEAGMHSNVSALVYVAARAPDAGEDYTALAKTLPTPPAVPAQPFSDCCNVGLHIRPHTFLDCIAAASTGGNLPISVKPAQFAAADCACSIAPATKFCTSTSSANASFALRSCRARAKPALSSTIQMPRLAVPIEVLTTQGNRTMSLSSSADFTKWVAGCGRPNSSSSRLKPALLCAVR